MKYQTTKKQCQEKITGVCDGCGGKLEPMKTVDNSNNPTFWAGCRHCMKFCWGVDKNIWRIARTLTEEGTIKAYSHLDPSEYETKERREYYLDSQTAGAIEIVRNVLYQAKRNKFEF